MCRDMSYLSLYLFCFFIKLVSSAAEIPGGEVAFLKETFALFMVGLSSCVQFKFVFSVLLAKCTQNITFCVFSLSGFTEMRSAICDQLSMEVDMLCIARITYSSRCTGCDGSI